MKRPAIAREFFSPEWYKSWSKHVGQSVAGRRVCNRQSRRVSGVKFPGSLSHLPLSVHSFISRDQAGSVLHSTVFPSNPRLFIHSAQRTGQVQLGCSLGRSPKPCPPEA